MSQVTKVDELLARWIEFNKDKEESDNVSGALIAMMFSNGRKVERQIIDEGYDCSDYPEQTSEKYKVEDYPTTDDFLGEATNETVATFESGHGITCKTLSDDLDESINEWQLEELNKLGLDTLTDDERDEFWDKLAYSDQWGWTLASDFVERNQDFGALIGKKVW